MELELTNADPDTLATLVKVKKQKYKKPKKEGTDGNFINNSVLFPEVVKCKVDMIVSKELAEMIILMSRRYCSAKNWAHLPYRDDLVQASTLALFLNILKFNPEKGSNVFSYATTILYHSCLQYVAHEKKQNNIRQQLIVDEGVNASLSFMDLEHEAYRERHADFFQAEY